MAKKNFFKTVIGIGAVAVAGKLAYDKYKTVKDEFIKEENDSTDAEVKKYNAILDKKVVEIEDEEFNGCEIKSVCSKTVIDLGLAVFEKDVYINFSSDMSVVKVILPEGVNVVCDIDKTLSGVRNLVDNTEDDDVCTVYIIGKALCSSVEIIPVNFYVDDDETFESADDELLEFEEVADMQTEESDEAVKEDEIEEVSE